MKELFAGDYYPIFRKKAIHEYTLTEIPPCEEVHDGYLYSTKTATLIAYSLRKEWFRGHIEGASRLRVQLDGLYHTSRKRYFSHHYVTGIMTFNSIDPLSLNEARQQYQASDHKLIQWSIPAA